MWARIKTPTLDHDNKHGFTIVELLIVIVVVGILAAITIVAYNGVQQRARDAIRKDAAVKITKALELYYIDHESYPNSSSDSRDANFLQDLKPYLASLPLDPQNNVTYFYQYIYYVPNYKFNVNGCKSGDYVSTGMWILNVQYELASSNPFSVGSGALATDKTNCGTAKNGTSNATRAGYFSPLLERAI